jgi:sporulation protein YtfJ
MIDNLVKTVLAELHTLSKTKTVIGDPIEVQNKSIIPISKVSIGFGIGGGDKEKNSTMNATGGGISIEPLAFIVVGDDQVELITLEKAGTSFGQIIDIVPKIIDKVKSMKNNKSAETVEEED